MKTLSAREEKFPDLILTGDWHLRDNKPLCRIDDFWETQWEKVKFISKLQKKYNCPILHGGDLFHVWNPSLYLLSTTMQYIPNKFYTVYGNHDLPQHNLGLANKCGIFALEKANKVNVLDGCHWGCKPNKESFTIQLENEEIKILVYHVLTYKNEQPYPGCTELNARSLLYNNPEFKLILTSDNHQPFTQTYKGRLLVNPGSMMRQDADQYDYKPAVWLYYADTNTVEPVYLLIDENAVSREHLEVVKERDERIAAFIEMLDSSGLEFVNFERNLEIFLQKNKIEEDVKDLVYQLID